MTTALYTVSGRETLGMRTGEEGDLAARTLAWSEQWLDPAVGGALVWNPEGSFEYEGIPARSVHLLPQSAWVALGLLRRDGPGDRAMAAAVIEAVLADQYDEPATVWHGTFRRFHETPQPAPGAREWVDYDPNWRQFLGTTLALVLHRFEERLDPSLRSRIARAIRLAVQGEPPQRVQAGYSNIALMRAWLEVDAGLREDRPDWVARGEALGQAVLERFERHGAFDEYNSPTYYGVDLYGLALWARQPNSAVLAEAGARLEAALWRDAVRWYHAGLRNQCGPFTRSYGLDLDRYAGLIGLWIWDAVGAAPAPWPDLLRRFEHSHDTMMGPVVAELGSAVPADAAEHLLAFSGERTVEQVISADPARVATGWLGTEVMCGGERGLAGAYAMGQYMPATMHWAGGALRVEHHGPTSAVASAGRLGVQALPHRRHGPRPLVLAVEVADAAGATWDGSRSRLRLPGLCLAVHGPGTDEAVLEGGASERLLRLRLPAPGGPGTYELVVEGTGDN